MPERRRLMPLLPWVLLATLVAGCSDAPRPVKALTPGLHAINQKPLFINSLGMQFVPLPGGRAWVSVWETRVSDYAAFAAATTNGWHAAWFQETTNHPAVEVRWDEAEAFCAWLSQRERASGLLGANEGYRLPTSDEWTSALGQTQDGDPSTISGNFGPALKSDSFPHTSEVGTFQSNALGLHDLRGNVWEWCTAWPSEEGAIRILRGGGWRDHAPELLAPGRQLLVAQHAIAEDYGFRCVLVLKRPPQPE
ncbi:MAG: SUMF1/EgtB/PvdO family nonheme iron enzyme [Verrucomicrobiota bacterium]|nr:SUMF1/EgtB/PvdO family nonheme iron enzyme [Verrucomicrobiota bacterium]